jgi:hypothetical protein
MLFRQQNPIWRPQNTIFVPFLSKNEVFVWVLLSQKQKSSLFAADRCKTVVTKQETWSESKTLMSFHKDRVYFLPVLNKKNLRENSHSSQPQSEISSVLLKFDFPARRHQPIIDLNDRSRSSLLIVQ